MSLSKDQEDLYKKTLAEAKRQLEAIDAQMERELQKVREKLAELQESKKTFRMIYEGTAKLLGVQSDLEAEDESAAEMASQM